MINPRKVKFWAKKKENENIEFRIFLKIHADEEELDKKFSHLHEELFNGYDCSRCRNCCKQYAGSIPEEELKKDAQHLNITVDEMKTMFLKKAEDGRYVTLHVPCDFLNEEGECRLGACRPDNCRKYPYTNQPDRLHSLYTILEAVNVCPVAYEIFERLKQEYGFHYK